MEFSFSINRSLRVGKGVSLDEVARRAASAGARTGREIPQPYDTRISAGQVRELQGRIKRMHMLEDLNGRADRSFDAAVTTKYNADLRGTYGSANAEIMSSDYTVVARARTVAKDTPQGKAIVRTFQNDVVGDDPFKLDMRVGEFEQQKNALTGEMQPVFVEDEETNRVIEEWWEVFGRPENFTVKMNMSRMEAFRILEGSAVRDGFIMVRHQDGFPKNDFGYAIELLERDRLQSQFMGIAEETGNPIRFSVEYDKRWNYPEAYWILTRHPGDIFGQSTMAGTFPSGPYNNGQNQLFRERVPAEDVILFNNLRDRAEQDVGFTELDASVQSLWRLFQYEKALTYAAISSCMKPFWIKKDFPTGMQFGADEITGFLNRLNTGTDGGPGAVADDGVGNGNNPVARQQGIAQRVSADMPGSTLELEWGQSLEQTDPKFPVEAAHEFRLDNARDIAVATGVSYQDVSGDFQNLGFAAALMCQTPKQAYCKIRQRNFIDNVVRPIFRRGLRAAILSGYLDLDIRRLEEFVNAAKFKGKRWPFVNPLVQAQTLIIMMEAGILAPQQVQDQLPDGVSIETLYTLMAEAKSEQQKHGLDFSDVDVTRPTINKGEPGQTAPTPEAGEDGAAAPAKTKVGNPVRARRERRRAETMAMIQSQGEGRDDAKG